MGLQGLGSKAGSLLLSAKSWLGTVVSKSLGSGGAIQNLRYQKFVRRGNGCLGEQSEEETI